MIRNYTNTVLALGLVLIFSIGCKEEEKPLAQILAGFSSTSLGLTLNDAGGTVSVEISRTDAAATIITLNITEDAGTAYGVDYSTEPEAVSGVITLEIAAGETSAQLVVNKLKNPEFEEVKGFLADIVEVSNGGDTGVNGTLSVTFEENPTSSGAELTAEVGGPEQPNQVFIDLSKQTTVVVDKGSWDIGFNNGDANRVVLNYATYAMVKPTDKTDLSEVTDAIVNEDFKADMTPLQENTQYMDDPAGDLTKTTIAEVKAADAENLVYIINRGRLDTTPATDLGYLKFKVTLSGNDYVITYGDINDVDNFSTATIAKDAAFNFSFFSFDDGAVSVEPEKANWDFSMTTFLTEFPAGPGVIYSYAFSDYSLTNKGNVMVSSVEVTETVTYDGFSFADLSSITLEDNRTAIGSSWRIFNGDRFNPDYLINEDLFYVIEDTEGNYYKIKFTDLKCAEGDCVGDRGYPKFVYELLVQ